MALNAFLRSEDARFLRLKKMEMRALGMERLSVGEWTHSYLPSGAMIRHSTLRNFLRGTQIEKNKVSGGGRPLHDRAAWTCIRLQCRVLRPNPHLLSREKPPNL